MHPIGSYGTSSAGEISLVDLSPVGAGLSTHARLSEGEQHLLIVEDHHGCAFESLAEVRWRTPKPGVDGRYRSGLAFVSILQDDPAGRWTGVAADPLLRPSARIAWPEEETNGLVEPKRKRDRPAATGRGSRVLNLAAFRGRRHRSG